MRKVALVLFNLGGPDSPEAVQPFLFNLFNDKAIIRVPQPVRWLLAQLISKRRAPVAREIYAHIGGLSPILANTEAQATALQNLIGDRLGDGHDVRCFSVMRYWHPRASQVVRDVATYDPDDIVLLPLYPQYSTTTTTSSLSEWQAAVKRTGIPAPCHTICCYPQQEGFITACATAVRDVAPEDGLSSIRVLFSAHGLPRKIIDRGDPYQWQIEQTADAIAAKLGISDSAICYQSRIGPLEWIGPSVEEEIKRAAADQIPILVAPIAFVSEHSETLVELDIEYRELANKLGVPGYYRAETASIRTEFIKGLADIAEEALKREGVASCGGRRICPNGWTGCAMGEV